jgi:hypothetical protein
MKAGHVRLVQAVRRGDAEEYCRALTVKSAEPLWYSRRGTKIHRIKSAVIFINQRGRMSATWWCGNFASDPIAYRPECGEGLSPCESCERKWLKR